MEGDLERMGLGCIDGTCDGILLLLGTLDGSFFKVGAKLMEGGLLGAVFESTVGEVDGRVDGGFEG